MRAIIDKATDEMVGVEGEPGAPTIDPAFHDLVDIPPGWPTYSAWQPAGRDGRGFYPLAPQRLYTFNQWVDLFPLGEQIAIVTATMTDPMAKLIYDRAQSASGSIDPADPRTAQGLGYLVSQGYVSAETFARITDA